MKAKTNKEKGFRLEKLAYRALMVLFLIVVLLGALAPMAEGTLLAGLTFNMFTISGLFLAALLVTEISGRIGPYLGLEGRKAVNNTYALIVDWLVSILCVFLFFIDLTRYNPKKNADPNQTPILLIHGYLHNSSGWSWFRYRLVKEGHNNVYTINLGAPIWSIEHYSKLVEEKAKEIMEWTGRDDLVLIGHSMGGIIASHFATHQTLGLKIKSVISLASPFQGTSRSEAGIGECAKQLAFGSEFLSNLYKKIQEAATIPFFHIGSENDPTIRPLFTAFVNGRPGRVYEKLGHMMYLFSDEVIDDVSDYLKAI